MSEPVFFISHFAVKGGAVDDLRRLTTDVAARLREEKPGTVLFLSYLDERATRISFLHAFPDADAMDRHFEGSDERAAAAYDLVEPLGWEFYGAPSDQAIASMRQAAERAGASLVLEPDFVAGFLRVG